MPLCLCPLRLLVWCRVVKRLLILLQTLAFCALTLPADAAELVLYFWDMDPFITAADGPPTGFVADRAEAIAAAAGLHLRWVGPLPRARAFMDLRRPEAAACVPNARLTPDRAPHYKASDPMFPPPDWVVVTRRGDGRFNRHREVQALLQDEELVFGRLLEIPLGPDLERLLEGARHVHMSRGTPLSLFGLLAAGRIDYFVADLSAFDALRDVGIDPGAVAILRPPDLPRSEPGRFLCSRGVPDAIILRLNEGIARAARARAPSG